MLWTLLSLVIGGIPAIIKQIAQAKVDLANARTNSEKIAAEERIKGLEYQRDVLIKETDSPWYFVAKFSLMAPFVFYFAWVIAYDKIICKWHTAPVLVPEVCVTDPLSPWLLGIAVMIYGFYFLSDITKFLKR